MLDSHFKTDNHLLIGNKGDASLSRTAAGTIAIGNGVFGDVSGSMQAGQAVVNGANGEQWICGYNTELLTLNTGGLTTDTTGNLLPASAVIESVVVRTVTGITTAANFTVGDSGTANRFLTTNTGVAQGSTAVGLNHRGGTSEVQAAAAKVRVTCNANPGAGQLRITVFYSQYTAPTA